MSEDINAYERRATVEDVNDAAFAAIHAASSAHWHAELRRLVSADVADRIVSTMEARLKAVTELRAEVARLKSEEATAGEWELVAELPAPASGRATYRLRVPGGWLYRYGDAIAFAPDSPEGWAGK